MDFHHKPPEFGTLFGDLLDHLFEAIAGFFAAILAWIGELFVSACEAVLGSDNLAVVIPSGLAGAVILGSVFRLLFGGGMAALLSVTTLVVIAVLVVFFELAILMAILRRRKRS